MWGKCGNNLCLLRQVWIKEKALSKETEDGITQVMLDIEKMLIEKNRAYGDSALEPVRIFSKSNTTEQLYVRIDDKLSRIEGGHEYPGDDTIKDLIGYLVLLLIAKERDTNERIQQ
jgi:hypothetical protein